MMSWMTDEPTIDWNGVLRATYPARAAFDDWQAGRISYFEAIARADRAEIDRLYRELAESLMESMRRKR